MQLYFKIQQADDTIDRYQLNSREAPLHYLQLSESLEDFCGIESEARRSAKKLTYIAQRGNMCSAHSITVGNCRGPNDPMVATHRITQLLMDPLLPVRRSFANDFPSHFIYEYGRHPRVCYQTIAGGGGGMSWEEKSSGKFLPTGYIIMWTDDIKRVAQSLVSAVTTHEMVEFGGHFRRPLRI